MLLTNRDPVIYLPSAGGSGGNEDGEGDYQGVYSPTYLRLEPKFKEAGLRVPINRTRALVAKTDAANGYMQRVDNRGRLLISDDVRVKFGIRSQLHDGRLVIYFEPLKDQVRVGDKLTFTLGLQDDAMPRPVQDTITVRIVDEDHEQPQKRTSNGKSQGGNQGSKPGAGPPAPTHGLPRYILLTKDGRNIGEEVTQQWPEAFAENDGGIIQDLGGEGVLYKINWDNSYHLKYRLQQRGDVARDVVSEKYVLGMRILMLGYEHALRAVKGANGGQNNGIAEYADDFRRMAARGAASTVLALAENLPKIVDKSSMNTGQEVE
jgi:hypothetical protein